MRICATRRFRSAVVRSSRLPTRISAASPGSADAIANVITEIASRTAMQREDRASGSASADGGGGARVSPPPPFGSTGRSATGTRLGEVRPVEALVAEQRRVDALQVLRRDVLVRRRSSCGRRRPGSASGAGPSSAPRVLRLVRRRERLVVGGLERPGSHRFGYFGGFLQQRRLHHVVGDQRPRERAGCPR